MTVMQQADWLSGLAPPVAALVDKGWTPPLAIRACNPGHLKTRADYVWRGQIGATNEGLCIFKSHLHGIRAMTILFKDITLYYGLTTITGVAHRWFVPGDLRGPEMASFVGSYVNHPPTTPFPWDKRAGEPIAGVIAFLNPAVVDGRKVDPWYPEGTIRHGVGLSHER